MKLTLVFLGQLLTGYYFLFFFVIVPVLSRIEKATPVPESINAAVLEKKKKKA